jgi:hypothetical protein
MNKSLRNIGITVLLTIFIAFILTKLSHARPIKDSVTTSVVQDEGDGMRVNRITVGSTTWVDAYNSIPFSTRKHRATTIKNNLGQSICVATWAVSSLTDNSWTEISTGTAETYRSHANLFLRLLPNKSTETVSFTIEEE